MLPEKLNILLVSYEFPPSNRIGARRWGKFYEELNRCCKSIYVLTRENKGISSENIYFFKANYPGILDTQPSNFTDKILYKLALVKQKIVTRGSLYDKTARLKGEVEKKLRHILLKKNIDVVIATGAPFSLTYYVLKFKSEFPKIKFVVDLRDPWTWGSIYGFSSITEKRKQFELGMEKFVCENADLLTAPSQKMLDYLKSTYSIKSTYLLPHGFQKNNFKLVEKNRKEVSTNLKLIYGGTVYSNLKNEFDILFELLNDKELDFLVNFYTNQFSYYSPEILKELKGKFEVKSLLTEEKFFEKLVDADYYLLFYPSQYKDFISSKFYEIVYAKIPIILICEHGLVSAFITENKLGIHYEPCSWKNALKDLILQKTEIKINNSFAIEEFEYGNISNELLKRVSDLYGNS